MSSKALDFGEHCDSLAMPPQCIVMCLLQKYMRDSSHSAYVLWSEIMPLQLSILAWFFFFFPYESNFEDIEEWDIWKWMTLDDPTLHVLVIWGETMMMERKDKWNQICATPLLKNHFKFSSLLSCQSLISCKTVRCVHWTNIVMRKQLTSFMRCSLSKSSDFELFDELFLNGTLSLIFIRNLVIFTFPTCFPFQTQAVVYVPFDIWELKAAQDPSQSKDCHPD